MRPVSIKSAAARGLVLVAALAITVGAFRALDTTARVIDQGERFVPEPDQLALATLGFDTLVADYYWLMALQLVGDDTREPDRGVIARMIDVVTHLDPWSDHAYRFAGVWLTDSLENVQASNRMLARGVSYAPRDWRQRHYLGFNHFFYLGDHGAAADVLETAIGLPKTPRYIAPLVARLRLERDGLATARAFLVGLAHSTDDPYAEAEYLKSIDEIDTEQRARLLDQARAIYVERHGRDISNVADLRSGPSPILRAMPPAHPHFDGFAWEISSETGEIVSNFYGTRYRPHFHNVDKARRERWKAQAAAGEGV